eukprot:TRINITY_DN103134_c0_g1_i1.p1 TRINITY_DN103134_c0_g1~~TRINITY_DN103134_c0_g1_i1.p1  ORF type:complete len:737 (-),score=63.32 TRINITY_DN103134_c0_g1_i1:89-2083(-)
MHTSKATLSQPQWEEPLTLDVLSSEVLDGMVQVLLKDSEEQRGDVIAKTMFPLFHLGATENDMWLPLQFWDGYAGPTGSWQAKGNAEIQVKVSPNGFGDKILAQRMLAFKNVAHEFTMTEQIGRMAVEKEEATGWQDILGRDSLGKQHAHSIEMARAEQMEAARKAMLEGQHRDRARMCEAEQQQRLMIEGFEAENWGALQEERARLAEESVKRQREKEARAKAEWESQRAALQQRHQEFTKEVEWEKQRQKRLYQRELDREASHQRELKSLIHSGKVSEAQELIRDREKERYDELVSPPRSPAHGTRQGSVSLSLYGARVNTMDTATPWGGHQTQMDNDDYNDASADPNNFHYAIQEDKIGNFEATIGTLWSCRHECADEQLGPMYSDINFADWGTQKVQAKHTTYHPPSQAQSQHQFSPQPPTGRATGSGQGPNGGGASRRTMYADTGPRSPQQSSYQQQMVPSPPSKKRMHGPPSSMKAANGSTVINGMPYPPPPPPPEYDTRQRQQGGGNSNVQSFNNSHNNGNNRRRAPRNSQNNNSLHNSQGYQPVPHTGSYPNIFPPRNNSNGNGGGLGGGAGGSSLPAIESPSYKQPNQSFSPGTKPPRHSWYSPTQSQYSPKSPSIHTKMSPGAAGLPPIDSPPPKDLDAYEEFQRQVERFEKTY